MGPTYSAPFVLRTQDTTRKVERHQYQGPFASSQQLLCRNTTVETSTDHAPPSHVKTALKGEEDYWNSALFPKLCMEAGWQDLFQPLRRLSYTAELPRHKLIGRLLPQLYRSVLNCYWTGVSHMTSSNGKSATDHQARGSRGTPCKWRRGRVKTFLRSHITQMQHMEIPRQLTAAAYP